MVDGLASIALHWKPAVLQFPLLTIRKTLAAGQVLQSAGDATASFNLFWVERAVGSSVLKLWTYLQFLETLSGAGWKHLFQFLLEDGRLWSVNPTEKLRHFQERPESFALCLCRFVKTISNLNVYFLRSKISVIMMKSLTCGRFRGAGQNHHTAVFFLCGEIC